MVEWKKLGDICEVQRGKRLTKNLLDDNAAYPVYHGGLEPLGKYGQFNREANTVMVINVGASAGTVGFSDSRFWSSDGCFCISHSKLLNNKYLFYYLQTKTHYLQSQVRHAGIPTLDNPVVEKINLPILSISEQERIVGILDTFTSSIDNLKQQIAQRRKQYEYYRDQLLDLKGKEGVEMKKLGDISKVLRGKRLTKNLLDESAPYPVFHGGLEPLGRYGQFNREANTVMVINVGASAGTVGFSDCRFWSSDGCFCISHSEHLNNKYLFYYLQTKTHFLQSQVRHAGIPTLDNPVVEKMNIPVLSLIEQQRIVDILDKFEASIQNLEAQLSQREKQYEYYRNKLLTFE